MSGLPPLCVDLRTAASALGVSLSVVRAYVADGLLPVVRLPSVRHPGEASRRVLVAVDDLRAFVARHREEAAR